VLCFADMEGKAGEVFGPVWPSRSNPNPIHVSFYAFSIQRPSLKFTLYTAKMSGQTPVFVMSMLNC